MINAPDLTAYKGLSVTEAADRLRQFGPNELPTASSQSVWMLIFHVIREPMILLLITCAFLYQILGNYKEGFVMFSMIFVVTGIEFYQKRKAKRTLDSLKKFSSPRALVRRDNTEIRIPGREVVQGDIIIVKEGDRVPADALILFELNLAVDESLLSGESNAVTKSQGSTEETTAAPGGEGNPFLYSGTLVVQGQALGRVLATGVNTQMGKLGKVLAAVPIAGSKLQKETGRLIKIFAVIGLISCSVIVISYVANQAGFIKGLLAGLTLALSLMPEEFPVTLTIFLAMGAWRISKSSVLTREPAALEILGSTSVLCSDKTGTITENKMTVAALAVNGQTLDIPGASAAAAIVSDAESFHRILEYGMLASQTNPFDPMEKAIFSIGLSGLAGTEHIHTNWELSKEYPLTKELLSIARVFHSPSKKEYVIAAKGAPEAIFDLCHLKGPELQKETEALTNLSSQGLRVIAVARASLNQGDLPAIQHAFDFKIIGLIGFKDPVREGVPQAIAECHKAGIRVIMITGDHPTTASHIAREINLPNPDKVITGAELLQMNAETLNSRIRETHVFARIAPEQKIQIVQALKSSDETVIMTGDGVNDAPALKAADIGMAMGGKGTDVAREAASLVLLDDNFSSIVSAVRLGRSITANLQKAFSFIVASHFPIAILALVPVLLQGQVMILMPVHIILLEMLIDPACTLIFEAEKNPNVMNFHPLKAELSFFGLKGIMLSCLEGITVSAAVIAIYYWSFWRGDNESMQRSLAFSTLFLGNIFLILSNVSRSRFMFSLKAFDNRALTWISGGAFIILLAALYLPGIREFFQFQSPGLSDLAICVMAAWLSISWNEIYKRKASRSLVPAG